MISYELLTNKLTEHGVCKFVSLITDTKDLTMPLPSIEEQKQIVEYLEKELSKIDTLIETAKAEITLIEEYKTSLINEVVTGKIKIKKDTNEYRTKLNSATSGCYK